MPQPIHPRMHEKLASLGSPPLIHPLTAVSIHLQRHRLSGRGNHEAPGIVSRYLDHTISNRATCDFQRVLVLARRQVECRDQARLRALYARILIAKPVPTFAEYALSRGGRSGRIQR